MDPGSLFRTVEDSKRGDLSDLGDLSGLSTVGDVLDLAKSIKVRRPTHWPDGPIYRDGETAEMRRVIRELVIGKHVSFQWLLEDPEGNWFRQQIRECIAECVCQYRAAYEQRFPLPAGESKPPEDARIPAAPTPLVADHPRDEGLQSLSHEARELLSQVSLEYKVEILEFDKRFQEKFAEIPSFDLLERYCLGRFDILANHMLPASISADPTTINPRYREYLDTFAQKGQEFVRTVLVPLRSEVREEIASRIVLKLSSRKLHWSQEAVNWRLQRYPPQPRLDANRYLDADGPLGTIEAGSSLDEFIRRIAREMERERNHAGNKALGSDAGPDAPNSPCLKSLPYKNVSP